MLIADTSLDRVFVVAEAIDTIESSDAALVLIVEQIRTACAVAPDIFASEFYGVVFVDRFGIVELNRILEHVVLVGLIVSRHFRNAVFGLRVVGARLGAHAISHSDVMLWVIAKDMRIIDTCIDRSHRGLVVVDLRVACQRLAPQGNVGGEVHVALVAYVHHIDSCRHCVLVVKGVCGIDCREEGVGTASQSDLIVDMLVVGQLVARHCSFHFWSLHVTLMQVGRESELVFLYHDVGIASIHAVAKLCRYAACIARHAFLLVGDDVENASHTFGIILCAWIGEHLDVLDD